MKTKFPFIVLVLLLISFPLVPAPVPRCSPFIIINKLVEWTSLWSDSNSYFPVGPCEYGGPFQALQAGDNNAVFLLDEPEKIPRHNIYEFVWFLKTGATRMKRMMLGLEPFKADLNILTEGYQHYTPFVRTTQLGHGTERRPEIIDDLDTYVDFVGGKVRSLFSEGPDLQRTRYTPVGPLRRKQVRRRKVGRRKVVKTVPGGGHESRLGRTRTRSSEVDSDRKRSWSAPLLRKGGGGEGQWRPIVNRR